jgi:hypothetical protein
MKPVHCLREENIAKAIRTADWPPALLAHAAACAACRDALRVAQWMGALAGALAAASPGPLPDPSLIWQRAQLDNVQQPRERLRGVLEWAQITLAAAAPLGLATWVALNWYGIEAAAARFLLAASPPLAAYGLATLAPAALTLAALALGYPVFAGD